VPRARPRRPRRENRRSTPLSTKTEPSTHRSRRERRAAERARGTSRRDRTTRSSQRGSPIVAITALVGVLAVALIGALVLLQGTGSPAVDAAGLIAPTSPTPVALADGRSLGKADAPVTLDVWSDYQCPACGQYARSVEPELVSKYVAPGTLRIVQHDAAFQGARAGGAYDESVEAAAGARCAAAQNGFWPFHDWAFANQSGENKGAFADARLRAIATSAGLDVASWDACRATGEQQAAVRAETEQGLAQGVNATPTLFLNGQAIVGLHSAAELGKLIEAAAAAAK
jgi:protein-disulfide isomerase